MLDGQRDHGLKTTAPGPEERAWFVIKTKHYKEPAAQKRLEEAGLSTYLPLLHRWPRPAVGSGVGPMFPCYLFVRAAMPLHFHRVASTPGVRGFITDSHGPAHVDDDVIAFLRSRESPDGIIRYDPLPAGQQVRIVSGPFKGLVAIVQRRFPACDRVRVLLHLLQRATPVELPERCIRQG